MRLFAGIEFGSQVKEGITGIQEDLRKLCTKGRWKREDNFHLTLKFLGEVEFHSVSAVSEALQESAKAARPFLLKVDALGYFEGRDSIRVLWLGLGGDTQELMDIKLKIEDNLQNAGYRKESRRFSPHVTIAQDVVTNVPFKELAKLVVPERIPDITVNDIVLFKSEQINGKRVYTPLRRYGLTQE